MSKRRTRASTSKQAIDPLDVTDDICIKEEKIDEIKNEILDPDLDIGLVSRIPLEIKKEEVEDFPNDHFLIDPKDIPGIEKIVDIEDILRNSIDSTNLLNNENAESVLQNVMSSSKNSSVSSAESIPCNCMDQVKHYCIKCDKDMIYKSDKTKCPFCKTLLKLRCSKCLRKYKFLSSTHQYLLQYSKRLNLLSNEKKEITFKCNKQINFCCSVCSFKTENKEQFDEHVKTHEEVEKVKQNDRSEINFHDNDDDDFIDVYCSKCCKTKKNKNFSYDKRVKLSCKECQEVMLYQCTYCARKYKNLLNIRIHVMSKCQKRIECSKLCCNDCYFKTEDKAALEIHIKQMHTRVPCEHCKKEFVNIGAMKQHITKGCSVEKSKIKSLKNEFIKTESMKSMPWQKNDCYQIVEHHPDVLYNEIRIRPPKDMHASGWQSMIDYYCLLCDGQTNKKFSMFKPRCPNCKIKYEYRCKTCGKLFAGYTSIHKHVKSECPGRFCLQCTLCNFTDTHKHNFINHIKNKHTVFKCSKCESRYHGYLSLRKHMLTNCQTNVHDEKDPQKLIVLHCKQCFKKVIDFEDSSSRSCTKCKSIMGFQCLKCNQLFDDKKVTQNHVKNLCKPKFHCTKCKYKSYFQYELDVHVKLVHTTKNKCPDCGVQYRDEEIYKMHRLVEMRRKEEKQNLSSKQEAKRIKLN